MAETEEHNIRESDSEIERDIKYLENSKYILKVERVSEVEPDQFGENSEKLIRILPHPKIKKDKKGRKLMKKLNVITKTNEKKEVEVKGKTVEATLFYLSKEYIFKSDPEDLPEIDEIDLEEDETVDSLE